jgi:hypothetical protein
VPLAVGLLALSGSAATATTRAASASDVDVITIAQTATLSLHGKVHNLGDLGRVTESVAATPSGDLVIGDYVLKLITPSGAVEVLSTTDSVDGLAVSRDGRYVVWSEFPGGNDADTVNRVFRYDLRTRTLTRNLVVPHQVKPVGFLDDGRVALEGDPDPSYLWTPSTGALATVVAGLPAVTRAAGHLLVLSDQSEGCTGLVQDSRTGKSLPFDDASAQCQFLMRLSPDGTRWLTGVLSGMNDQLVELPAAADAYTGRVDTRLSKLFVHERTSMIDGFWLDRLHVLMVAERFPARGRLGEQLELLCSVPVHSDVSCRTLKDFGPYERPDVDPNFPSVGPDVWLAHPLGQ